MRAVPINLIDGTAAIPAITSSNNGLILALNVLLDRHERIASIHSSTYMVWDYWFNDCFKE
jgi:hypothetical protein